jgi:hypothetical protein
VRVSSIEQRRQSIHPDRFNAKLGKIGMVTLTSRAQLPESLVAKIWSLCNVLRGDGVSYHQYISELTYLLFLKIAKENGSEEMLSRGYRWNDLKGYKGDNLLGYYQELLTHLGANAKNKIVRDIYAFPTTVFSTFGKPASCYFRD